MKTQFISGLFHRRLVLLLIFFPVLSCTTVKEAFWPPTATPTPTTTSTPTPTNTPTPTRIPLAERDLKDIALQKSDLPDEGFLEVDYPDLDEVIDQSGGDRSAITENLATGFLNIFTSRTDTTYINVILVYMDDDAASAAFEAFVHILTNDNAVEIPPVGEECFARGTSTSGTNGYSIVWRYHEAMVSLDYLGKDDIGIDAMVRLAQIIQSRLEL